MTNAILRGKPDAGNPHVRFDEGEVASAKPRRGSLLYKELIVGVALLMASAAWAAAKAPAAEVCKWEGASMAAWAKGAVRHVADARCEDGVMKGTVSGLDPNIVVDFAAPVLARPNHVLYVKLKTTVGGMAQVFWLRQGDRQAVPGQVSSFGVSSDGEWHVYRVLMDWFGEGVSISSLRFDLPGSEDKYAFELASVKLVEEGEVVDVQASKTLGVAFSLQMPPGVHHCTIEWLRAGGRIGTYCFSPATDGKKHAYWFNLTEARAKRSAGRMWSGRIVRCRVRQRKLGVDLPVEDFRFVTARPDLPADVSIVTAHPGEAIPRAGRPFPVEILLRNYGTRPGTDLAFSFDGLPAGVRPLHAAELTPADHLPGSEGQDSILVKYRYKAPPLVHERRYVLQLADLGVGTHRFGVTVTAKGQSPCRAEVVARVQPSLDLAPCDYPPEPRPVKTGPYEVGAIIFPGWLAHSWEPDWNRAPWRKPVLGWYDESKPETVDWQIRQLVENGISFVCVNWYWSRKPGNNYWPEVFAKARYRRHLKWFLQWSNHNKPGSHDVEDQRNVTRYWLEHYFSDPQYLRVDGKPVVAIYSPSGMERDMKDRGGVRALLEVTRREVAAAGLPGIYLLGMRGPDRDSRAFLQPFEEMGFDATTVYHYTGSGTPGAPLAQDGSRPYQWVAESSYGHWRRLTDNSKLPIWPSLSTGRDDRIWNGEGSSFHIVGNNAEDFARICRDARRYADETGRRRLLVAPLDEWSEGEIAYPNQEHGFGFFEAIRDTFGEKGPEGWPTNAAPEDFGLTCPQLDLYALHGPASQAVERDAKNKPNAIAK